MNEVAGLACGGLEQPDRMQTIQLELKRIRLVFLVLRLVCVLQFFNFKIQAQNQLKLTFRDVEKYFVKNLV